MTFKPFYRVAVLLSMLFSGASASFIEIESLESSQQQERQLFDAATAAKQCAKLTTQWKMCRKFCNIKRKYHSCFRAVATKYCPKQINGLDYPKRVDLLTRIKKIIKPIQVSENCVSFLGPTHSIVPFLIRPLDSCIGCIVAFDPITRKSVCQSYTHHHASHHETNNATNNASDKKAYNDSDKGSFKIAITTSVQVSEHYSLWLSKSSAEFKAEHYSFWLSKSSSDCTTEQQTKLPTKQPTKRQPEC